MLLRAIRHFLIKLLAGNDSVIINVQFIGRVERVKWEDLRHNVEYLREPPPAGYCSTRPPSKLFYVDPMNGDDANDGLSWKTALATIYQASNCVILEYDDTIFVAAGSLTWPWQNSHLNLPAPTSG